MSTSIRSYVQALNSNQTITVSGLCGRIIRGKRPADFLTLTDDPNRKLVMLMGPDGLEKLLGKTGYEMLVEIGYEPNYLEAKVKDGNQFKLVVFPEGGAAKLATWDNVAEVVADVYPETAVSFSLHLPSLKAAPFDAWKRQVTFDLLATDKAGENDPHFMTYDRFRASRQTALDLRLFLYYTVHLRELFSGDGYTYTATGDRGLMEYIVANKPIRDLGQSEIIDLTVNLPNQNQKGPTTMSPKSKTSKFELPIPTNFNPSTFENVVRVPYEQVAKDAEAWAKKLGLKPAGSDRKRICLMPIDTQITFCIPGFELFVGGRSGRGAIEDNMRLAQFIYRYLGTITEIAPTMDTHLSMQIFHPIFWVDKDGNHPIGNQTMISYDDVRTGKWRVNPAVADSIANGNYALLQRYALHYVKKLTDGGKFMLMVWTYHAVLTGIGHALVPGVEEAIFFHTHARHSEAAVEIKGGNPLTENYSVLRPEVLEGPDGRPIAQKNTDFIEKLMNFDAVIIGGQAKSHCVAWTIDDLLTEILAKDPALARKVYLLEDCTSPVVIPGVIDFTDMADAAFERFAKAGMHIVKSTDPIETWADINL